MSVIQLENELQALLTVMNEKLYVQNEIFTMRLQFVYMLRLWTNKCMR